jgi:hypothetical protein
LVVAEKIDHAGERRVPRHRDGIAFEECAVTRDLMHVGAGEDRMPVACVRLRSSPEVGEAVRILVRERAQDNAVDDAEDGGVCANAERKQQDRGSREPGIPPDASHGLAKIAAGAAPAERPVTKGPQAIAYARG